MIIAKTEGLYLAETQCMSRLQSQDLAKAHRLAFRVQIFGLYKATKIIHNDARSLGDLAHYLQ